MTFELENIIINDELLGTNPIILGWSGTGGLVTDHKWQGGSPSSPSSLEKKGTKWELMLGKDTYTADKETPDPTLVQNWKKSDGPVSQPINMYYKDNATRLGWDGLRRLIFSTCLILFLTFRNETGTPVYKNGNNYLFYYPKRELIQLRNEAGIRPPQKDQPWGWIVYNNNYDTHYHDHYNRDNLIGYSQNPDDNYSNVDFVNVISDDYNINIPRFPTAYKFVRKRQ